jgi:predicted nuclease with TOPRIM domain
MSDKRAYHHRDRTAELQEVAERLIAERDELRAEVGRLNQALDMVAEEREAWEARAQAVEAEVERLRGVAWKHGNRADEAESEVERLRAAGDSLCNTILTLAVEPANIAPKVRDAMKKWADARRGTAYSI